MDARRLTGWKEIGAHLGKSVRTTQRWERQYGLPVHREAGDVVHAYADELDRWALKAVPDRRAAAAARGVAPPADHAEAATSPSRRRRERLLPAMAAAAILLGVAGTAYWATRGVRRHAAPALLPAGWRIAGGTLTVLDSAGTRLFARDLACAPPDVFGPGSARPDERPLVRFADVDGDGRTEVLVAEPCVEGRILCLEADGRLRFSRLPSDRIRFGQVDYDGVWRAVQAVPVQRPDGSRTIWAYFVHNAWFPSRLEELSPRGEVLSEYRANGHLSGVGEATLAGRELVLAWGTHNETLGASLAVFDRGRVAGYAPAATAYYTCTGCPEGGPREFLVFPRSCVWRQRATGASILRVRVDRDRLLVTVSGGALPPELGDPAQAPLEYEFDHALVPRRVRVSRELLALHARLEREQVLDHAYGQQDEDALQPVRRWDGRRFVPLARVPVERRAAAFGG